MHKIFAILLSCLSLSWTTDLHAQEARTPQILAIGDSLLASHAPTGRSIPDVVGAALDTPVTNRALFGARMTYRLPVFGALGWHIARQFRPGPWRWVIVNGGGNDLWFECNCMRCDARMNQLLGPDGSGGDIDRLVQDIRATGARVAYTGYLRSPGRGSPIEHCREVGNELERRIAAMAARDPGVFFIPAADLVPFGVRSFHGFDMIHPSVKGAQAIAERIAALIEKEGL